MSKYILTKKAVEDLSEIWNYTFALWPERQADTYYKMLIENFKEITMNPDIGKDYEGVVTGLLGFRAGRHIIFYRILNAIDVEIIRILHERMDLKNRIVE